MNILKWYSIIIIILALMIFLYVEGQEDEDLLATILPVLIHIPIIVYLILS